MRKSSEKDGQQNADKALQPICPRTLYPLPVFQQVSGLRAHAMRIARRNGLKVRHMGNRAFVWSEDFFDYLFSSDSDGGKGKNGKSGTASQRN